MYATFIECLPGKFGRECNESCGVCAGGEPCHHTNGTCLTGCEDGYLGPKCIEGTNLPFFKFFFHTKTTYRGIGFTINLSPLRSYFIANSNCV